jgi:glycosyltransferase involved in cell wall biosynthesis
VSAPLVSVLTPTFNGEAFVADTIESVLAQTHAPIEHILVDDGSTDGTRAILERYAREHPDRIRVLANDDRAGPTRRRNEAFDAARGEFIGWLDHDDLWLPEKTAQQLARLDAKPVAGLAYSQYELFEHDSGEILHGSRLRGDGDFLRRLFTEGCFLASSTALIRRDAMTRRGLRFRERHFSWGDDHYLWLELALDWDAVLVDEVLVRLRRHATNESVRLAGENWYRWSIALLDEFVAAHPEARTRVGSAYRRGVAFHQALGAIYELQHGRRARAAALALRAGATDPQGAARYVKRRAERALTRRAG